MFISEGLKIHLEELLCKCAFTHKQLLEKSLRDIAVEAVDVLQRFVQMVKLP